MTNILKGEDYNRNTLKMQNLFLF